MNNKVHAGIPTLAVPPDCHIVCRRTFRCQKHKCNVVFKESDSAHTWINWREYLIESGPQLF